MNGSGRRFAARVSCGLLVALALMTMVGCAAGPGGKWAGPETDAAGFFAGLWHGALLVVTVVVSFFTDDVRIYESHNVGVAYDIGFVLGVLAIWGNGVHIRIGRRRRKG